MERQISGNYYKTRPAYLSSFFFFFLPLYGHLCIMYLMYVCSSVENFYPQSIFWSWQIRIISRANNALLEILIKRWKHRHARGKVRSWKRSFSVVLAPEESLPEDVEELLMYRSVCVCTQARKLRWKMTVVGGLFGQVVSQRSQHPRLPNDRNSFP